MFILRVIFYVFKYCALKFQFGKQNTITSCLRDERVIELDTFS